MARFLSVVFVVSVLCRCAALGQSTEQLVSSLEKHTVVLRNYYTDASLTFDTDGKLISIGTPGFGPTDGRLYIEHAEVAGGRLNVLCERPTFFWDPTTSDFRLTNIGHPSEVYINLPSGQPTPDVVTELPNRIFLKQSELKEIRCSDGDEKIKGLAPAKKQKKSKKGASVTAQAQSPGDAQSLSELQLLCFPGGERAYRVGRGVHAPQATHAPDPDYSELARQKKVQGSVVLALIVDESGKPSTTVVTLPLGYGLDEKALDAVRTWTFKPATFQDKPVPVGINVEVNFRLY